MVTLVGSAGTVTETQWAQANSFDNSTQVIRQGDLVPTVGAGTREWDVAAGWVKCCGGFGKFTGASSGNLAANGGSNARIDFVVAEFNWQETTSTLGTPANSVGIVVVQGGGGGGIPALTQTPGTLWQVPIAKYTVPAGGGAISVEDVRPLRKRVIRYTSDVDVVSLNPNANARRIARLNVADPGWPYLLSIAASVDHAAMSGGNAIIRATVDSAQVGTGRGPAQGGMMAHLEPTSTGVRSGIPAVVDLTIEPFNIGNTDKLVTQAGNSQLLVIVHPA